MPDSPYDHPIRPDYVVVRGVDDQPIAAVGDLRRFGFYGSFDDLEPVSSWRPGSLDDAIAALPTVVAPAVDREAVLAQIEELTNRAAVVVSSEAATVPAWCSAPARLGSGVTVGPLRAHGPWVPVAGEA